MVLGHSLRAWSPRTCCKEPVRCRDMRCPYGLRNVNHEFIVGVNRDNDWTPAKCCQERVLCATFTCPAKSRLINHRYICGWQPYNDSEEESETVLEVEDEDGHFLSTTAVGLVNSGLTTRVRKRDEGQLCSVERCCEQEVTCENYRCQRGTRKPAPSKVSCGYSIEGRCNDNICCEPPLKCESFQCPDDHRRKNSQLECPHEEGCSPLLCCIAPRKCKYEWCPKFHERKADDLVCGYTRMECTVSKCCEPPVTCKSHTCGSGLRLKRDYRRILCIDRECQDAYCCDEPPTCGSWRGGCPDYQAPEDNKKVCGFDGCTVEKCCYCPCKASEWGKETVLTLDAGTTFRQDAMKKQEEEREEEMELAEEEGLPSHSNQCDCPNGIARYPCAENESQCVSCLPGYDLDVEQDKCKEMDTCWCQNGLEATDEACYKSKELCMSCNDGYIIDADNRCTKMKCTCLNGDASEGSECNGGESCASCKPGFMIMPNSQVCVPNAFGCLNGTPLPSIIDPTKPCGKCNIGFKLDNGLCRPNKCHCENGTEAATAYCHSDGAHICSKCNDHYGLDSAALCKPTCAKWLQDHKCETGYRQTSLNALCDGGICTHDLCCFQLECKEEIIEEVIEDEPYLEPGITAKPKLEPVEREAESQEAPAELKKKGENKKASIGEKKKAEEPAAGEEKIVESGAVAWNVCVSALFLVTLF